MGRRSDRKRAFEILFEKTFFDDNIYENLSPYTLSLVNGVDKNRKKIDELIKLNIKNWKFERISRVSRCALRLGIYEMMANEIPVPVAINESVEIAKIYATEDDANYVQAVLSAVSKNFQNEKVN